MEFVRGGGWGEGEGWGGGYGDIRLFGLLLVDYVY